MRRGFLLGLVITGLTLLLSQDPYILLPDLVFLLALAGGVVVSLISLMFGLLSLA
jgi:hypothetical protein